MPQLYVIGIDIGTGSTKAVAVNNTGEVLASAQFYYDTLPTKSEFSEQDPEAIWQAFINSIISIVTELKGPPACISLSSCMHSLLVLDDENNLLTNLITWADSRSSEVAERIRQSAAAEAIYTTTGTPIHSMSPLCKIIWLRENASGVFKKASKFIGIKEFIWHRLFNTFEIDFSIASATGLFDITSTTWNDAALTLAGIHPSQLSTPVPSVFFRNYLPDDYATLLNIPSTTPFCIGASDGCLANAGTYALTDGTAAVTIGTSGAVRIASKKPLPAFGSMTFSYILDEKLFICGAPISNGGNILQWLLTNFIEDDQKDVTDLFLKLSNVTPGSEGLICLPYLHGERAPVWDEKAAGVFFGIRSHHKKANFLRAALEGVCFSIKSIINILEDQGSCINQLHVSGGFIHSEVWMQMLSDVTGKKICVVQTEDASATGAAFLGMKAINMMTDITLLEPKQKITIQPDLSNTVIYNTYYKIFKTLYEALKVPMHQLYHLNH